MIHVRDVRSFVEANKPKVADSVRVRLCVNSIEEAPMLWRLNCVDAGFVDRRDELKGRIGTTDRNDRNQIMFQVTMGKPRKCPFRGVSCPYKVGDVATIGKIHKLRFYYSLLQGELEAEAWMVIP
ncbi:hypothetical protein L916_09742 [Phytophthora nicotianae]|uniref:Uncharacterized protein n=1 Tax=Phytophthora nicotianae TaxID=4792 RepID=W2IX70_PHYNI|nr:hypothetical protein L916_09742 [Phytophthora nicotianae]